LDLGSEVKIERWGLTGTKAGKALLNLGRDMGAMDSPPSKRKIKLGEMKKDGWKRVNSRVAERANGDSEKRSERSSTN